MKLEKGRAKKMIQMKGKDDEGEEEDDSRKKNTIEKN